MAFAIALAAALSMGACTEGDRGTGAAGGARGLVEGIVLARVGTIGDYPPADSTLVVEVTAEGKISVAGEDLTYDALGKLVAARAGEKREDDPMRASALHYVLRLDESLPWAVSQWLLIQAANPDVRVYRTLFAVLPEEGDDEGTLAAFLPRDRGLADTPDLGAFRDLLTVKVEGEVTAAEVTGLYHAVRGLDDPAGIPVSVAAGKSVTVGTVLRAVDVLYRAGIRQIQYQGTGTFPRSGDEFPERLAEAMGEVGPGRITLDDRLVTPAEDQEPMPPVERIRGSLAGTTEHGILFEEIIEEGDD